ncbi:hypothetical protein CRG98_015385 [Punica granatum]|uniref:Glycine-rich protein-like n=1 Tax=Punica granatum TaxID=22663 RepID=A0A2I0K6M4_PUNGR|nr:hypothetical protein CRG98_015385 [Punica granatum]
MEYYCHHLSLKSINKARIWHDFLIPTSGKENGVDDAKYSDGRGGYNGQYPGGGYGGGLAKGCRHGCCKKGKFKYAKCIKCCASAAEAAQMATEVKPQN